MSAWLAGRTVLLKGEHRAIEEGIRAAGAEIVREGAGDLLVHVAPPPPSRPALSQGHVEWRDIMSEGLDARFAEAARYAQQRREQAMGGAILFVGAPAQALGADHAAAAGALGNLTKTLGVEWARDAIRVNTMLTLSTDASVGRLAAYLLSDYAAYLTGMVTGYLPGEGVGQ